MNNQIKLDNAIKNFDNEIIPNEPPSELPLLNKFKAKYKKKDYFCDTDVLFIQHHLGPFLPKLKEMNNDGLEKVRCWFVDIPYSTNLDTKLILGKEGFGTEQMTNIFNDPLDDYDKNQSDRVKFLLFKLASKKDNRKLLVVDDGAYFLRFLYSANIHDPKLAEIFKGTRIVEQTTRGHRFIENQAIEIIKKYKLNVVSIARCHTKINFESAFIGATVSRALTNRIGDDELNEMKYISVIGFGAVGKATTERLLKKSPLAKIDVIDINESKRDDATKMSNRINALKSLNQKREYELIVGCTGDTSFELSDRKLLVNGAYLASGSSAAVEFNRQGFVELADKYPDDEIEILDKEETIKKGIHANIRFSQERGRIFTFLNSGFPVNFDGKMECLPPRVIQSTHTLLYAAAIQAVENSVPGTLQKIDGDVDHWIYNNSFNYL